MQRSGWFKLTAITFALGTVAAACGSDSNSSSDTTAAPAAGGETTAAAAAGGGGDYVIGVSNTLAGNGWREEMICAVKAQALASGEVSKVIAISKNGGPTEQIQDLQNLISQGVNAIVVNPSDREKLNPVIEEAAKQGIVVVAVDQAVTAPSAYVATNDQVAYGKLGAQWLADQLGGKGSVLYMRGIDGVPADADRDKGFQEVIAANPDIKVKEVFSGWDFTKGGDIAVQELTAADYDGIWTSGIDFTVVNAFDTVGKDPVPVVGADNNEFLNQLLQGKPGAAVTNPAVIGGVGTAIALQALDGKNPEKVTTLTPAVWDKANNEAELKANYFPDRDKTFSSAVTVDPYTTYTPEQLFACKGPGE
jgi:ribose transport system substrate-binding protein